MSLHIIARCNGKLGGRECRNTVSLGPLTTPAKARTRLAENGWKAEGDGDYCRPCALRRTTIRARQGQATS